MWYIQCESNGYDCGAIGPFKKKKLAETYVENQKKKAKRHSHVGMSVLELHGPRTRGAIQAIRAAVHEPDPGRD